jgi:hypothetical protein
MKKQPAETARKALAARIVHSQVRMHRPLYAAARSLTHVRIFRRKAQGHKGLFL